MNKKINIVFFSIFAVAICMQTSFSAIVSDNDGSAFVTKAEFDALKNNFNKQIDDYNKSIDGKIDGAIASYLSGIQISTINVEPNYYDRYIIRGLKDSNIYWTSATDYAVNKNQYQKATWDFHYLSAGGIYKSATETTDIKFKDGIDFLYVEDGGEIRTRINSSGQVAGVCTVDYTISGFALHIDTQHINAAYLDIDYDNGVEKNPFSLWHNGCIKEADNTQKRPTWTRRYAGTPFSTSAGTENHWLSFLSRYSEVEKTIDSVKACLAPKTTTETDYVDKYEDTQLKWVEDVTNINNFSWLGDTITSVYSRQIDGLPKSTSWLEKGLSANAFRSAYQKGWRWNIFTKSKPSEYIYADFKSVNSNNCEIKNGVVLLETSAKGKLKINITPSENGTAYVYTGNSPQIFYNAASNMQSVACTKDNMSTITFNDLEKNTIVWFGYLPSATDKPAYIKTLETIIEKDA